MRRRKKKLLNQRGESYIDTAIAVLIIAMIMVVVLNLFSVMQLKRNADLFAEELVECATTYGRIGTETNKRIEELKKDTGLNPAISYEGTSFFDASNSKIQLGETIEVTVTVSMNVKGLGAFSMPITVTSRKTGLSQVFWK